MGSLYNRGSTWWISYYSRGKRIREGAETTKKTVADALLKQRNGEVASGKTPSVHFDKVTFDELLKDLLTDYAVNARKNRVRAEQRINKHLVLSLSGLKVREITTARIRRISRRGSMKS
jgi:hypothetical protein